MRSFEQVHEDIEAVALRLEELTAEIETAANDDATKEAAYKVKFHSEFLKAKTADGKPSDKLCEATAIEASQSELRAHLLARGVLSSARDALRARMSQMDGLRTQAASYRGAGG